MTYGVYEINKIYIKTLKQAGYKVDSAAEKYCGPVYGTTENGKTISFFVPIDNSFDSQKIYIMTFKDNTLAGIMNFNNMIPCFEQFLKSNDADDGLIEFCSTNENFIKMCAEFVINHNLR